MDRPGGENRGSSSLAPLLGAGLELAAIVAVLTLFGRWLDTRLATAPWLLIGGATIGVVGGLYRLWKVSQRMLAESGGRHDGPEPPVHPGG
jgi:hypothetical protein